MRHLLLRLRALFFRRRTETDLDEELQFHVAMQTRKHLAAGVPVEDARRQARRQFGGFEKIKDECRDERGLHLIESTWQDIRHACRLLGRRPGLTVAVALTLGAGVGVTTAIFSLIYAILLRPFPYPEPEQLVRLYSVAAQNPAQRGPVSVPELEALRARTQSFSGVGAYLVFDTNLAGDGAAQSVKIGWVTPGLFELTGVRPMLGRSFEPADDELGGDNHKVVLGHHIWRDRFGSDPGIIGRTVRMRLLSYTVIGVMPPGYRFPSIADVWAPLQSYLNKFDTPPRLDWSWRSFDAIARLKPDVSLERARSDLLAAGLQIARDHPASNRDQVFGALTLRTAETGELRPYLTLLTIAVACVLVIACVNIASLLLTQALARTREFMLRASIGAGRVRVIRQLVTESLVLALVGGMLGLLLAVAATRALVALIPVDLPAWISIQINWTVLLFSLGLTVLTGLLFGLAPAFEAARGDLQSALRPGTGGTSRTGTLRKTLVIVEVALSCVLLVVSGLMLKAFLLLYTSAPGFDPRNLLTSFISPHRVGTDADRTGAYWSIYKATTDHLGAAPGIISAAGTTSLPYAFQDNERPRVRMRIFAPATNREPLLVPAWTATVSPKYFATMGIPLLAGRDFAESDTIDRECAVIISERAAQRVWGGARALGEAAQFGWGTGPHPSCRVIGIVGSVRYRGSDDDAGAEVYWSYRQREAGSFYVIARTSGRALDYAGAVRDAVGAADRETGIITMTSMEASIGESLWRRRLWGVLLGTFALLALVLAAIGLYGVLSYTVRRRTREIGIRLALGASRVDTIALVCREAAVLVVAGSAAGLAAAFFAARAMSSMLYRVPPHDATIFIAAPLALAAIAVSACYLPARRAGGVDPVIALRHEE